MIPPNTWQGFYTARAALEAGELADARGDRAFAEHEFLTALRLWERGDSVVAQLPRPGSSGSGARPELSYGARVCRSPVTWLARADGGVILISTPQSSRVK